MIAGKHDVHHLNIMDKVIGFKASHWDLGDFRCLGEATRTSFSIHFRCYWQMEHWNVAGGEVDGSGSG